MSKHTALFARLSFADVSFVQVRALAEYMIACNLDTLSPPFSPMMAGLVVTYAKNLVSADGIGPLNAIFSQFTDSRMQEIHDKLIHARHRLYAHRDALSAKTFTYDNDSPVDPYEVKIQIRKGEPATVLSGVPELPCEFLPFIVELCMLQRARVESELMRIVPIMTKGKRYGPGIYTVGVDFP